MPIEELLERENSVEWMVREIEIAVPDEASKAQIIAALRRLERLTKVSNDLRDYAKHLADHHVHGDQWHALVGFISSYDKLMKGFEKS